LRIGKISVLKCGVHQTRDIEVTIREKDLELFVKNNHKINTFSISHLLVISFEKLLQWVSAAGGYGSKICPLIIQAGLFGNEGEYIG